jgi:hypothetical protein
MSFNSKKAISAATVIAILIPIWSIGLVSVAQESAAEPQSYTVYTEAYKCDWSRHAEADAIYERVLQPAVESALKDGVILGWAYMKRALGDEWSRVLTLRFENGRDIFEIRKELRSRVVTEEANELNDFFKVCGPHRENIYRATGRP